MSIKNSTLKILQLQWFFITPQFFQSSNWSFMELLSLSLASLKFTPHCQRSSVVMVMKIIKKHLH